MKNIINNTKAKVNEMSKKKKIALFTAMFYIEFIIIGVIKASIIHKPIMSVFASHQIFSDVVLAIVAALLLVKNPFRKNNKAIG